MTELLVHDLDAEESVLGSILIDGAQIKNLTLKPEDFYSETGRVIYGAMTALYKKGSALDQICVARELDRNGKLKDAGGAAYLSHLISIVPTSLDCPHYAQIVKELSQQRRMIGLSLKGDFDGLSRVLREANRPTGIISPIEMADSVLDIINRGAGNCLSWGFKELDNITGGAFSSELVVIGGRPSMGKSQVMLQMAMRMARAGGNPVVASLEMSKNLMSERIVATETGINLRMLKNKTIDEAQHGYIAKVAGDVSQLPIHFVYGRQSISEIYSNLSRQSDDKGVDALFIDYLQLISDIDDKEKGNNMVQRVGYITRSLKGMAEEFDIPVVVLSQLSRAVESREGRRPTMADLRESGNIEQDADVIFLLYADDMYNPNSEKKGVLEVIMAKNRQLGGGVTAELRWDSAKRRYV